MACSLTPPICILFPGYSLLPFSLLQPPNSWLFLEHTRHGAPSGFFLCIICCYLYALLHPRLRQDSLQPVTVTLLLPPRMLGLQVRVSTPGSHFLVFFVFGCSSYAPSHRVLPFTTYLKQHLPPLPLSDFTSHFFP